MDSGTSLVATALRFIARIARDVEATAYRRLRDLELKRTGGKPSHDPGAPRRAREAAHLPDDATITPV
jgi:hypothetical protein